LNFSRSSLRFSHYTKFVYSLKGGKPHSLGLKSNNELRTWSAPLWYETSSLGSGTITADLHKKQSSQRAKVCKMAELTSTYIPAFLAAATPDGASSKTKHLLGSTLP
jgi:hypothetical protein